jgi:hypothetical protein
MMLHKTVGEIEQMGAYELAEWRQLCADEVVGDERSDYWQALMVSTYVNSKRDTKKQAEPFGLSEFMPRRGSENENLDDDPLLRND